MNINQVLTPLAQVRWLSTTDSVRDAFDHMETYGECSTPLLDWSGRYVGTVTEADLRRHIANTTDRAAAFATALSMIERRSHNEAVTMDRDVESVVDQAAGHRFIPVVDALGKLVGIVDRRRLFDTRVPSAA